MAAEQTKCGPESLDLHGELVTDINVVCSDFVVWVDDTVLMLITHIVRMSGGSLPVDNG